jgi:hypothetical protein
MATCEIKTLPTKACTGKCTGTCKSSPAVWVMAACEGMISLFEKQPGGSLKLKTQGSHAVSPTVEDMRQYLAEAVKSQAFSQLVLIGSANDIAWAQALLPQSVTSHIVAEIQYPLIPAWFRQLPELRQLTHALEQVFAA